MFREAGALEASANKHSMKILCCVLGTWSLSPVTSSTLLRICVAARRQICGAFARVRVCFQRSITFVRIHTCSVEASEKKYVEHMIQLVTYYIVSGSGASTTVVHLVQSYEGWTHHEVRTLVQYSKRRRNVPKRLVPNLRARPTWPPILSTASTRLGA